MKKNMVNEVVIEGYLYEHNLEERVTGAGSKNPGTPYIRGSISIATDEDITNIVRVFYTYVTPTTKNGKQNFTYNVLKDIIDGRNQTHMKVGKEFATKLRARPRLALNEFYSDRNGTVELVSTQRNQDGFLSVISSLSEDESQRNTFAVDMVVTSIRTVEGDEESGRPDRTYVKGTIFDFRNSILPVEFVAEPGAIAEYFAEKTTPMFMHAKGTQVNSVQKKAVVKHSEIYGETTTYVDTSVREVRIVDVTTSEGWDEEGFITAEEFKAALGDRETYKAELRNRYEENKNRAAAPAVSAAPVSGEYNFDSIDL